MRPIEGRRRVRPWTPPRDRKASPCGLGPSFSYSPPQPPLGYTLVKCPWREIAGGQKCPQPSLLGLQTGRARNRRGGLCDRSSRGSAPLAGASGWERTECCSWRPAAPHPVGQLLVSRRAILRLTSLSCKAMAGDGLSTPEAFLECVDVCPAG